MYCELAYHFVVENSDVNITLHITTMLYVFLASVNSLNLVDKF